MELFTSEGCSSCPPADKLLEGLERDGVSAGRPIIVLSEHVDYWDGLGWKDVFSSSEFTARQKGYAERLHADSYTPQMVVDGRNEFVGNDATELSRHLAEAAPKSANVSLRLNSGNTDSGNTLDVSISGAPKTNATVLLAITESALVTHVKNGENGGRELHHAGVVRTLHTLGSTTDGAFAATVPLHLDAAWKRENLRAVILVQEGSNGPIVGAASQRLK